MDKAALLVLRPWGPDYRGPCHLARPSPPTASFWLSFQPQTFLFRGIGLDLCGNTYQWDKDKFSTKEFYLFQEVEKAL